MSVATTTTTARVVPVWPVLVAVAAAALLVQLPLTHATAWHYFDEAAGLLVGDGRPGEGDGLHLYRDHPELQFGPLSIAVALPFALLGEEVGEVGAMIAASAAGLVAFAFVLRTVEHLGVRPSRLVCTFAGIVFVAAWSDVAVRTAHIDDAIALLATAAAMWACASRQGLLTAVLLGIAAAAKPWAIAFGPVVLAVEGPRLVRVLRLGIVGAIPALTWAPFVLAERRTLDVGDHEIDVDPTSTLRALGSDALTTPEWARPAQVLGGFALALLVTRRGRWHAAVLAAVSWRLLLEPGAHRYYTAGAVLGALLVELVARPGSPPWRTLVLAVVLEATATPDAPEVLARTARLAVVVAALVLALTARPARRDEPAEAWATRGVSRTASRT